VHRHLRLLHFHLLLALALAVAALKLRDQAADSPPASFAWRHHQVKLALKRAGSLKRLHPKLEQFHHHRDHLRGCLTDRERLVQRTLQTLA
jgi:hypothetical protein